MPRSPRRRRLRRPSKSHESSMSKMTSPGGVPSSTWHCHATCVECRGELGQLVWAWQQCVVHKFFKLQVYSLMPIRTRMFESKWNTANID
jgi:hypothetical protein